MLGRVAEQQRRVARLADRAGDLEKEALQHRERIRAWQQEHLARPETLAWIYAAGVTWGISRPSSTEPAGRRGNTLKLINVALVASRMIGTTASESASAGEAAVG